MGMPTDATFGFAGSGISTIGNMFAANNIAGGQLSFLEGQKGIIDRQYEMDKERVDFEAGLRANRIQHDADIDAMTTDLRIFDARRREDLIKQRAKSILYASGEQEKRLREYGRAVSGAQRAAVAASGLSSDSGTYEEAIRQTGDRIEEDAGILRYNLQLAVFANDMDATEAAKEARVAEIYRAGIQKTADIDKKLTLLAGTTENIALRSRANIAKLNIDSQKFAVQQSRNTALMGSFTDIAASVNSAFESLTPVQKKTAVRVPSYNPIKPGVGGTFATGIVASAY